MTYYFRIHLLLLAMTMWDAGIMTYKKWTTIHSVPDDIKDNDVSDNDDPIENDESSDNDEDAPVLEDIAGQKEEEDLLIDIEQEKTVDMQKTPDNSNSNQKDMKRRPRSFKMRKRANKKAAPILEQAASLSTEISQYF